MKTTTSIFLSGLALVAATMLAVVTNEPASGQGNSDGESFVVGSWLLTVPGEPANSPTRFIVTFESNKWRDGGNVRISQAFGDRNNAAGHWNSNGKDKYRFQDTHFQHDIENAPYPVIATEEHFVNLEKSGPDEMTGSARIVLTRLSDGEVLQDFEVQLLATRLPYPDF